MKINTFSIPNKGALAAISLCLQAFSSAFLSCSAPQNALSQATISNIEYSKSAPTRTAPTPISARKIGGLNVGFVSSGGMSVSSDGRFLAMLSAPGEKGSDCIVFERATHRSFMVPGSSRMEPLCFARSGNALWIWGLGCDKPLPGARNIAADAQFIALYDVQRQRYLRAFSGKQYWGVPSQSALSRDGKSLIVAWQDGWVRAYETQNGRQLWSRRAQENGDAPSFVTLNDDGSKFLRTSDEEDGDAQITQIVATRSNRVLETRHLALQIGCKAPIRAGCSRRAAI